MDWMNNPIANMYGPHFLLFYGVVIVLTLVGCWWTLRRRDLTGVLPVPPVPSEPDPYEIAYLRGGEEEVTRVVMLSLTQRGYLQASTSRIEHALNHPDLRHLSEIERAVFDWFSSLRATEGIFQSKEYPSRINAYCGRYQQRLQSEQLIMPEESERLIMPEEDESDTRTLMRSPSQMLVEAWKKVRFAGVAVILGLGGYKLAVALARGRYNVFFLIIMAVVGLIVLFKTCRLPRITRRGRAYLERLEQVFGQLKDRPATSAASAADMTLPLVVGLFGSAVLAGTAFDYYRQEFKEPRSSWSSGGGWVGGCGGGCGGDGGGCGGGCGGCGGCGG